MWKEVFDGDTVVDRLPSDYYGDEESSLPSRRASAASDDSFDASCYTHVDNKLKSKMPKCLLNVEVDVSGVGNHFEKADRPKDGENVTKSGKRVIRKRLSISQFRAARMHEKNANNNSNSQSDHANNNDLSSSDSDSMQRPSSMSKEKADTNVLSAKIQHLLFEMKRLRQLDRDILRKFLVINDTIEEQRWVVEEKQAAIKRSLSEEGEDPVAIDLHFDLVQEVPEEEDDEESIQSVLSRQNSGCEVFDETLPADELEASVTEKEETTVSSSPSNPNLVFTSSESALSLSGASSTLSSTASFPVSNRSTSPPASHLSESSRESSYVSSSEQSTPSNPSIAPETYNPEPRMNAYSNDNDIPVDIEGYYRMYGSAMKRGSYPFPKAPYGKVAECNGSAAYDDLENAYASSKHPPIIRRASDAIGYSYATKMARKAPVSMATVEEQRTSAYAHSRPRSASSASVDSQDVKNRVQRISVRPDGTREPTTFNGLRRQYSANDKNSAAYRLLQHPIHQKVARMNGNRLTHQWSFVPIEEQEPDMMYDNGRIYPKTPPRVDGLHGVSQSLERRDCHNGYKPDHRGNIAPKACPPPTRKPSGAGSAGSLTSSSSRTSSSSLASSSSNSSLHSPTKFMTNEADRVTHHHPHPMMPPQETPVWVQRRRHPISEYIAIPYNETFPAPRMDSYYGSRHHGAHNLPAPESDPVRKTISRSFHSEVDSDILTVSYKPKTAGTNEAVYNWIQTQDDVTYL